ncbi:MAG TPA: biopolymer transporter ExbD [Balneolaceae bacterium]|nr:biopolymer transporter ExbD [Balneolaceae bacterium]
MFSQSSLTDIIFLLLIFFLLTSSFVTDHGIMVNIPQAQSSVTMEQNQVSVSITPEGSFFVEGEQVPRAGLADAIRLAYQNKPNSTLVVRADRDARVDDAVQAMNIGKALNMNIVMATERD